MSDNSMSEHRAAVQCIVLCCRILLQHDLGTVMNAISHAETIGPILDPTLFRDKQGDLEFDKELVGAALPLWRKAKEIEARIREEAEATP